MLQFFDPAASYTHERYKLFWIDCKGQPIANVLRDLDYLKFPTLNVGKELSPYIQERITSKYLHLDIQEYIKKLITERAATWREGKTPSVAIFNLGVLFEPDLRLDPSRIIRELSREIGVVILWEAFVEQNELFHWGDRSKEFYLNFNDTNILKVDLQHEVQ